MKPAILDKISRELSNGIDTEPKALYLLAEIRKYIDSSADGERDEYSNLYFYCNWVLHASMDHTPAKNILKRFESSFLDIDKLQEMSKLFIRQERDFYSFVSLKKELQIFFNLNGLPIDLIESGGKWFKFKKLLVEILMDCPLENEEGRASKFSYERGLDGQIRFRVQIKNLGSFKVTLKEEDM